MRHNEVSHLFKLKQTLRKTYRDQRKSFLLNTSAEKLSHIEGSISNRIKNLLSNEAPRWFGSRKLTLAIYSPLSAEINAYNLIRGFSVNLALPCIEDKSKNKRLIFRKFENRDTLITGRFNVKQPHPTAEVSTPDILMVPMLAFDSRMNRLGYGQGYYDLTISALQKERSILTIGVAFDFQRHEDALPYEEHDVALDYIVTEKQTYSASVEKELPSPDEVLAGQF